MPVNLFLAARMTNNAHSQWGGVDWPQTGWASGMPIAKRQNSRLKRFAASVPIQGIERGKNEKVLEQLPRREIGDGIGRGSADSRAFAGCG